MAQLKILILGALFNMAVSLITGKFLKKLVLLIVEPFVKKSKNTVDDKLLETAKEDLGISEDK
jgi:hypothetical protein